MVLKPIFFFFNVIYLFLERGEGKEKERERNINMWLPFTCPLLGTWPATQACALTGNRTCDPLVRSPYSVHWATPARAKPILLTTKLYNCSTNMCFVLCYSKKIRLFLWVGSGTNADTKYTQSRETLIPSTQVMPQSLVFWMSFEMLNSLGFLYTMPWDSFLRRCAGTERPSAWTPSRGLSGECG